MNRRFDDIETRNGQRWPASRTISDSNPGRD
jgi:hypothetical protein